MYHNPLYKHLSNQLQHQQQYVHIQLIIFVLFGPVYLYPELKLCDRYNLLKVVLLLYIVTERNSNEKYKAARVHTAANAIISTSVYLIFSCAVKATGLHQVAALVQSV